MKTLLRLCAILLILNQHAFCQKDSITINKIDKTGIDYSSYVLVKNLLFALNDSGKLIIWDLKRLDTISFSHNNSSVRYTAKSKNKNDDVFIGTNKGDLFKIKVTSENLSFTPFLKVKYTIRYIFFNSLNELFLIVPNALYDPISKKHWDQFENHAKGLITTKKSFIFFHKRLRRFFSIPKYVFLDSEDRLWMTTSYGEFGTDLQVFDIKSRVILDSVYKDIHKHITSIQSIFEDRNGNVYMTSGLQHFTNFGAIYKIDQNNNWANIYDTTDKTLAKQNNSKIKQSFLGPGSYHLSDSSLYVAASTGFYKLKSINNVFAPEYLFSSTLSWSREPLAIGMKMAIIKLEFTDDDRLLFETQNNGFGLYNNKNLVFIK